MTTQIDYAAIDDPFGAFDLGRQTYLRYLDSPFRLRYEALLRERTDMFDADGRLYRNPLFEVISSYKSSGLTVEDACAHLGINADVARFLTAGLFPRAQQLFTHQLQSWERTMRGEAVVVTTGTGSGKTECYLLPILAYLADDSRSWPAPPGIPTPPYWRTPGLARTSQRGYEVGGRSPAVRALVLYPLNALVEDQLVRIRRACTSPAAKIWLARHREGNRFWFGRYVGTTPVAGLSANGAARSRQRSRLQEMDEDFRDAVISARHRKNKRILSHFENPLSSEMWSRWDMQEAPPDILITNYSMLNIMLMRDVEQSIFSRTERWLKEDRERNLFYLVVDEIHSYRGTPGTEVGYLLRCLINRLGLSPDSKQLRIVATSASQGNEIETRRHLSQLFGADPGRFVIIGGEKAPFPRPRSLDPIREKKTDLTTLADADTETVLRTLKCLDVASGGGEDATSCGETFLNHTAIPGMLENLSIEKPFTIQALSQSVFLDSSQDSLKATRGILRIAAAARNYVGEALLQLRVHCFFHNAGRIWACVNPQCHEPWAFGLLGDPPPVGRLFPEPQAQCPSCHSRVLELLYCQPCGETFIGGYKKADVVPNAYFLSPDFPDLQHVPDRTLSLERTFGEYAVFWPARGRRLVDGQSSTRWSWTLNNQRHSWEQAALHRGLGRIEVGVRGAEPLKTQGFVYVAAAEDDNAFPAKCPQCGADWKFRRVPSPIRDLGSGFQRTVQVLNDSLMRELPENARKLVLYSDSRSDAAKLSTGIKLAHYRDLVRQIAFHAGLNASRGAVATYQQSLRESGRATNLLELERALLRGEASADQLAERATLITELGPQAMGVIAYAAGGGQAPSCLQPPTPPSAWVAIPFSELLNEERCSLLAIGVNPGGPGRALREFGVTIGGVRQTVLWESVIDWNSRPRTYKNSLQPLELQLVASIEASLTKALIEDVLFADGSRDCESLRIGYLWIERTPPRTFNERVAASVLRLLLQNRRWLGSEREGMNAPPDRVNKFIQHVQTASGIQLRQDVINILRAHLDQWLVRMDRLFLLCPSAIDDTINAYICARCTRLHMHESGGICTRCLERLPRQPVRNGFNQATMDYYEYLARCKGGPFRLNSEELTGQTNANDRLSRQRRFQNVFMATEVPDADGIDLLSVTTTMEAGVDIGELQAIGLANMPPVRFNYQQRVGRAGRRGRYAMSTILTMCRGRSHDEYYFQRPTLMTSESPPAPYVDVDRKPILLRVLNKEVLFRAFQPIALPHSSDDVHGEFGDVQSWPLHRGIVADWIASNESEIASIARMLARQTAFAHADSISGLVDDVSMHLIQRIDAIAQNPDTPGHWPLSQQLATEGLLPMFGFPTRIRYLYHQMPRLMNGALDSESGVIDRPLDIAISQFAPGAQSVKDDQLLTAVGVVDYRFEGNQVRENPNPLGPAMTVGVCRRCQALVPSPGASLQCPYCLAAASSDGYRPVNLSEPPGFRTWYPIHPDFSGGFEFAPRALRARMGAESIAPCTKLNFTIDAIPQARVFRINDNDGQNFEFRQLLNSNTWITQRGFDQAIEDLAPRERNGIAQPRLDDNVPADVRALASIETTDVLTVTLAGVARGLNLNPSVAEARAAWYSFGFLLRRAMAVRLDVSQAEIDIGIQPVFDPRSPFSPPSARIFISDTLENGAGYSSHFADARRFQELLNFMLDDSDPEKSFAGPLLSQPHLSECSTSCYRCLREYGNMAYHPLLDWRLGLDMVRLALDSAAPVDLSTGYWRQLVAATAPVYFGGLGLADVSSEGFAIGESQIDGSWTIVSHPLWDSNRANLRFDVASPYVRAELAGHTPQLRSIFRIVRFPYE